MCSCSWMGVVIRKDEQEARARSASLDQSCIKTNSWLALNTQHWHVGRLKYPWSGYESILITHGSEGYPLRCLGQTVSTTVAVVAAVVLLEVALPTLDPAHADVVVGSGNQAVGYPDPPVT